MFPVLFCLEQREQGLRDNGQLPFVTVKVQALSHAAITAKGMCLSPYWDLFNAGIECATYEFNKGCIQTLTKEKADLERENEELNIKLLKAKEIIKKLLNY